MNTHTADNDSPRNTFLQKLRSLPKAEFERLAVLSGKYPELISFLEKNFIQKSTALAAHDAHATAQILASGKMLIMKLLVG